MAYRLLLAALFLSILVANGVASTKGLYWFIYLTHWGLILQTLQLMVSAAVPIQQLFQVLRNGTQRRRIVLAGY